MISKECRIEAFVEALKDMDSMTVISNAIQEATEADRLFLKKDQLSDIAADYSKQLKKLINYHRYATKPHRSGKTTYNLYMKYWGDSALL